MHKNRLQLGDIKPRGLSTVVILVLTAATNLFFLNDVEMLLPAMFVFVFTCITMLPTGYFLAGRRTEKHCTPLVTLTVSFIAGMVVFTAAGFVLLHWWTKTGLRVGVLLTMAVSTMLYVTALPDLKCLIRRQPFSGLPPYTISAIAVIATVLCAGTVYGLNNPDDSSIWGWNIDKFKHLHRFMLPMVRDGLPGEKIRHNWLQVYYLGMNLLWGPHSRSMVHALYKVSGLPIFFATFALLASGGRRFFDLSRNELLLLILMSGFLGALIYPLWTMPEHTSYYLKFYNFTGYYHNTTLWVSNMIALGGVLLFLRALDGRTETLSAAALLVTGSFFFKPSFYTVLAPVMLLFSLPLLKKHLGHVITAGLILIVPVLFWISYPSVTGVSSSDIAVSFEPFAFLITSMKNYTVFPPAVLSSGMLTFGIVLLLSFPLLLPAAADTLLGRIRKRPGPAPLRPEQRRFVLFLLTVLLLAFCERILLSEDDPVRIYHGNFGWALQSAYFTALPLLILLLRRIQTVTFRVFAAILLLWQLLCGIWKYISFIEGKL